MGVSKNKGTPKSSILIGFSIINHPFWGTPIFGNTHMSLSGKIENLHPSSKDAGMTIAPESCPLDFGTWRSMYPQAVFHFEFIGLLLHFFPCLLGGFLMIHWMFHLITDSSPSFFGDGLFIQLRTHARMFDSKHMLKTNLAGVKCGKMPNASKAGRYL